MVLVVMRVVVMIVVKRGTTATHTHAAHTPTIRTFDNQDHAHTDVENGCAKTPKNTEPRPCPPHAHNRQYAVEQEGCVCLLGGWAYGVCVYGCVHMVCVYIVWVYGVW